MEEEAVGSGEGEGGVMGAVILLPRPGPTREDGSERRPAPPDIEEGAILGGGGTANALLTPRVWRP